MNGASDLFELIKTMPPKAELWTMITRIGVLYQKRLIKQCRKLIALDKKGCGRSEPGNPAGYIRPQ